jgi:hypothetical protein
MRGPYPSFSKRLRFLFSTKAAPPSYVKAGSGVTDDQKTALQRGGPGVPAKRSNDNTKYYIHNGFVLLMMHTHLLVPDRSSTVSR